MNLHFVVFVVSQCILLWTSAKNASKK